MKAEKEQLTQLISGDHRAFELVYHRHKSNLVRHLLILFKSDELAEEVAQDAFVTIWQERHRIDPEGSFRSYLHTIATHKAYNLFRKASYDNNLRAKLATFYLQEHHSVDDYMIRKENRQMLEALLDQMPARQREVFRMAKVEGYSYQEISEQLNISPNTINTHLKRANQFLKSHLTHHRLWLGSFLLYLSQWTAGSI